MTILNFRLVLVLAGAAALAPAAMAEHYEASRPAQPVAPRTYNPGAPGVQPASAPSPARLDQMQDNVGAHHRPTVLNPTPATYLTGPMAAMPPPPSSSPLMLGTAARVAVSSVRPLGDVSTNNDTSTVNEPSLGVRGNEILFTGNWYASFSTDGGNTFAHVDPWAEFPAVNNGFCCDQVALYDAANDMMIWFLQYIQDGSTNTVRVAVATGADIITRNWSYYDFSPPVVGNWNNEWFDYPELALSNDFLYITTNTFSTSNQFTRAVILKVSLAELASGQALNYAVFSTTQNGSLRPTHGALDTMYFASHENTAELRIFEWADNSNTVITTDAAITPWPGGPRPGWTSRSDHRVTGAWVAGNEIGFAWTAGSGSGFAHPHIRVAIFNRVSKALVAQPHIFNPGFPFAYPAAAPNADGDVGMAFHFGPVPNHAVATLENNAGVRSWDIMTTATSSHSPNDNKWGDYGAVRPDPLRNDGWVATGYTLQGGGARADIVPHMVRFNSSTGTPPPPPPPPPPPTPLTLTMVVDNAGDALGNGDRRGVTVTASRGANPAANETVTFRSLDARLSVDPASGSTGSNGVVRFDVINNSGDRARITVEAAAGGVVTQATVRIPALSTLGLLSLISALFATGVYARRARLRRGQ